MSCLICNKLLHHHIITCGLISCVSHINTISPPKLSLNYQNQTRTFQFHLFSNLEIDDVIKNLPNNKSPGPDGFNNEFYKKCWNIIKANFYNLCRAFHGGNVCLKSLNSSPITLIAKTDSPAGINDYRPISLLNSFVKLLTKILANRLHPVITKLIYKNQYGHLNTYIFATIQRSKL